MANKMLIDATHPEETRVVVLRGNRVEEFDFESAHRKQLRGNIYLAKVTRVEPSLQAAFVDYGGNRHGFLAFSEIHPDYYQIPVADRQALLDEENRAHNDEDDNADRGGGRSRGRHRHKRRGSERHRGRDVVRSDNPANEELAHEGVEVPAGDAPSQDFSGEPRGETEVAQTGIDIVPSQDVFSDGVSDQPITGEAPQAGMTEAGEHEFAAEGNADQAERVDQPATGDNGDGPDDGPNGAEDGGEEEIVESVGGDAMEEVRDRAPRYRRQYKIQEVIKRRQVMLVQVVKEERGTKGAALTTYLSLAGRYSVLMPNTARGGGISRKVTNAEDRKKMKEVAEELEVPEGMGVILRTAGANRTKLEVKRDFEYLLRLWETVRDLTLKSTAPTLVYEEGSLVKRSIRDLYHKDIDDIVVEGESAYREAKDFMRMLMPSHAKNVHLYKDPQPLFARYGIETQLDGMFSATVQLKSGGYIVLNQTEALVAIDVNSGRATREHSIEETALKTNSEAAAEIARQLRLRDLAGLIVIDFIDMDENRNNRSVERKLKEALKSDRARIQVGRISHFGLMEMSRQRIRSSVLESSTETCPHCGGTGHVRSVSSVALQLLRSLEETLLKGATHNLIVRTRSDVAIYVLNNKRAHLRLLEERFRIAITITTDPTLAGIPAFAVDRGDQVMTLEQAKAIAAVRPEGIPVYADDEEDEVIEDPEMEAEAEVESEAELPADGEPQTQGEQPDARGKRRRRGRRGRGRGREDREGLPQEAAPRAIAGEEFDGPQDGGDIESAEGEMEGAPAQPGQPRESREDSEKRRRRRGRRGGRRNRRGGREGNGDGTNAPYERDGADDIAASPSQGHYDEGPRDIVDSTPTPSRPPMTSPPPVEPPVSTPAEAAAEQGAPRRRSTIREPAPGFGGGSSSSDTAPRSVAPPAPPAVESSADEADKPRRGGWWRRG